MKGEPFCSRRDSQQIVGICHAASFQLGIRGVLQASIAVPSATRVQPSQHWFYKDQKQQRSMVLDSFQLSGVVPVSHMSTNSLCMAWCMLGGRCFSSSLLISSGPGARLLLRHIW